MDSYKVDVTGDDLLSKGAGVIVVYNNEYVYAYKFDSSMQKNIRDNFNGKRYGFSNKKILKPRVYCAVLTTILEKISREHNTDTKRFVLDICRDFSGQEQNIIDILREHVISLRLFEALTSDNYLYVKHPKKSIVQVSAQKVWNKDWVGIEKVEIQATRLHNLIAKPKARKKKW